MERDYLLPILTKGKHWITCLYRPTFLFLTMFQTINCLMAQDDGINDTSDSISVLTSQTYFMNPPNYLKHLDSSKIKTKILIDREIFRKDIVDFNGKSKVKTCDYEIWRELYRNLKNASNDSGYLPNINLVRQTALSMILSSNQMIPIGIIMMKYNKILKKALHNKSLIINDSCLIMRDKNADSIFETKQVCTATTFDHVLHGSEVKFLVSPMYIFLNDTSEKIKGIDIDFGNGNGFIKTQLNVPFSINFGTKSKYVMAKVRITYLTSDSLGKKEGKRYAHLNFLYSGTDAIPEPGIVSRKTSLKSTPPTPDKTILYPAGSTADVWTLNQQYDHCWATWLNGTQCTGPSSIIFYDPFYNYIAGNDYEYYWTRTTVGNYQIEATVLWGKGNASGYLRKAILISDAFDPGNVRNYYSTHDVYNHDLKIFDPRGLYQILNGDKSAWSNDPGASLAQNLISAGYDLVFINYASGDGDIKENANRFSGFFRLP
jgi:hypothetical protein